jgi:DUF1365 family protein
MNPANAIQLCFGRVLHARLRPVQHRFDYGVYFMRLPLRAMGSQAPGTRLFSVNRFNLLSFHERDHGDGATALLPWIDALLRAEGITDATGEIWLQAFPRVLGYVFNPVSFWFCHRADGALRAVLCEVRNTFGEKHCYLLDTGGSMPYGVELKARKVFHVSPFCAIEGGYRFRFMRSTAHAAKAESTVARIDHDDALGLLINTSISGEAATLSDRAVLRAFFTYPLMTFGVVAKIHLQALRLWLKRVPFFSKPAAPSSELSR